MSMPIRLTTFTTPATLGPVDIRLVDRDGEIWFLAADVCWALGYTDTTRALEHLVKDDERAALSIPYTDPSGATEHRPITLLSEAGLYSLVLRTSTPVAQEFKRWITHEVLPSIRQHGIQETAMSDEEFIAVAAKRADTLLKRLRAAQKPVDEMTPRRGGDTSVSPQ
jgi:prophage antirepressor-like protein